MEKLFISTKEASAILGICEPKIRQYCRSRYKGFPGVMDGNRYRIRKDGLPDWVKRVTEDGENIGN